APGKGAEPDAAVLFRGIAGIDGEPRVKHVAGVPLTALDDLLAFVNGLVVDLRFTGPASGNVCEVVAIARRQVPDGGLRALDGHRGLRAVADGGRAPDDSMLGVDAIVYGDLDGVVDVLQHDIEIRARDFVRNIAEHKIPDPILTADFQSGLVIAWTAPARVFL